MGRNPADTARGRGFFERALALDPDNLDAAIGLACADGQAAVGYYVDDKAERLNSVEANLKSGTFAVAKQRASALLFG